MVFAVFLFSNIAIYYEVGVSICPFNFIYTAENTKLRTDQYTLCPDAAFNSEVSLLRG